MELCGVCVVNDIGIKAEIDIDGRPFDAQRYDGVTADERDIDFNGERVRYVSDYF